MKYEVLLNLAIFLVLALTVVFAFRRLLGIISRFMDTGTGSAPQKQNSPSKWIGRRKGKLDKDNETNTGEREQVIARAEAVRQEMQKKIVTRFVGENPENTAKIMKTLLTEKENEKK
jgi:flagellar biosynthesis/type III secretory pathway M-ring protein FliF/YscJ